MNVLRLTVNVFGQPNVRNAGGLGRSQFGFGNVRLREARLLFPMSAMSRSVPSRRRQFLVLVRHRAFCDPCCDLANMDIGTRA